MSDGRAMSRTMGILLSCLVLHCWLLQYRDSLARAELKKLFVFSRIALRSDRTDEVEFKKSSVIIRAKLDLPPEYFVESNIPPEGRPHA